MGAFMDIVIIVGENDAAPYQEKLDALSPGRFLAAALPCGEAAHFFRQKFLTMPFDHSKMLFW